MGPHKIKMESMKEKKTWKKLYKNLTPEIALGQNGGQNDRNKLMVIMNITRMRVIYAS